ncbi:hypothetical protein FFWV33_00110 [Flavobacterium faecale]|uniref:F5/8 type C domain-containing protein n=1 Tax=Flavobacterium faecale TaxID=1355330 RepID=A0A2S1L8Y7_9FLAO|nr:polysaccharide lyase family 7 protein [Flavobacterium faecale]AWG20036.1 hypothetical protein FFWV33_00110 [Flavobacterium faecale]
MRTTGVKTNSIELNFKKTTALFLGVAFLSLFSCENQDVVEATTASVSEATSTNLTAKVISSGITVTDNGNDGNVAANAIDTDSDYATSRWASQGTGKYITLDLGATYSIDNVAIMWYQGTARKAYFKIMAGSTTSNLATVYDATSTGSNGTSTSETYSFTKVSARYVRIYCNGNSSSTWNSIIDVKVNDASSITTTPTTPTTTSTYPGVLLGINTSTWKVNSFTGAPGTSAVYVDDMSSKVSDISKYFDSNYFYASGSYAVFHAYSGMSTSTNSHNSRVELREMTTGAKSASWDGSSGTHTMTWTVNVDQLNKCDDYHTTSSDNVLYKGSAFGKVAVGQIHGPSTNSAGVAVDDIIRVQMVGAANATSGNAYLVIGGYIAENFLGNGKDYTVPNFTFKLDTDYTFTLKYTGGKVYLYNGTTLLFSQQMDTATDSNYFKAGCYLQATNGKSGVGKYVYDGTGAIVKIKNLSVTHN